MHNLMQCCGIPVRRLMLKTDCHDVVDNLDSRRRMSGPKKWAVSLRLARLRDIVKEESVLVQWIAGGTNPADELTKPLPIPSRWLALTPRLPLGHGVLFAPLAVLDPYAGGPLASPW